MAKICLSLTAKTIARNLEILEKYRKYADMVELRVDCLAPNERLYIRRFPEQANIPVILAIRRDTDGGFFTSGESARINLMAKGLAYADTDKRRNFAYLEIDKDLSVPSLEEAARTFGTRIIRSYYNIQGSEAALADRIHSIRHSEDEIVKVEINATSITDVLDLLRAGKECGNQEKILIAKGHYGMCSRILAKQFGSFLSYASALAEPDALVSPGVMDIEELSTLYRFRGINNATRFFGITGHPLTTKDHLNFYNTLFRLEDMNALYVPFPADSLSACLELARELHVEGLSVGVPYRQAVVPLLDSQSAEVKSIGACNNLLRRPQGWVGNNTEARSFSDSLLYFTGKSHLRRQRVTVIGNGGSAKAVIFELHRLGAKVLVLNRAVYKARDLAAPYKFAWGGLDSQGIAMMSKYRDIIIQATHTEANGNNADSLPAGLEMYRFRGREEVMDLTYRPEMTAFLKQAAEAGCRVQNGYDMLIRLGKYQYAQFTGKEFPEHLLAKVQYGT